MPAAACMHRPAAAKGSLAIGSPVAAGQLALVEQHACSWYVWDISILRKHTRPARLQPISQASSLSSTRSTRGTGSCSLVSLHPWGQLGAAGICSEASAQRWHGSRVGLGTRFLVACKQLAYQVEAKLAAAGVRPN